jgi:hypothetical protein
LLKITDDWKLLSSLSFLSFYLTTLFLWYSDFHPVLWKKFQKLFCSHARIRKVVIFLSHKVRDPEYGISERSHIARRTIFLKVYFCNCGETWLGKGAPLKAKTHHAHYKSIHRILPDQEIIPEPQEIHEAMFHHIHIFNYTEQKRFIPKDLSKWQREKDIVLSLYNIDLTNVAATIHAKLQLTALNTTPAAVTRSYWMTCLDCGYTAIGVGAAYESNWHACSTRHRVATYDPIHRVINLIPLPVKKSAQPRFTEFKVQQRYPFTYLPYQHPHCKYDNWRKCQTTCHVLYKT